MNTQQLKCNHHTDAASCVKKVPIFNTLSPAEMERVQSHAHAKRYQKGEILFLEGERLSRLLIVHEGKVKLSHLMESGEEHIVRILSPGDFIGEYAIFEERESEGNAEALEPTEICVIEKEHIQSLIEEYPVIAVKLLKELSHRLKETENLVSLLQMQKVEQRIATVLLQLCKERSTDEGETVVTLDISKGDLASYLGITAESLSRKLSSFQKSGWINMKGQRQITIKNRDVLRKISAT